jgi:hypothetical protein
LQSSSALRDENVAAAKSSVATAILESRLLSSLSNTLGQDGNPERRHQDEALVAYPFGFTAVNPDGTRSAGPR